MNMINETGNYSLSAIAIAPHVSRNVTVSCCLSISVFYVASLYIWNNKHDRDHPSTVKRRFLSVTIVMLITPAFVYKFCSQQLLENVSFNELLGLRWQGFLQAMIIPYLITNLLFLGPICVDLLNSRLSVFLDFNYWKNSVTDILWLRNHVVAPLSEEFVFRACMMPLILQSFNAIASVFITPLFFGVAHIHHIIERINMGMDFTTALIISMSQLTYTTLFGFYSSYLFVRTGHFIAPFLVHAFCNHMGLPDLQELWKQSIWKRILCSIAYVIGFVGWAILLPIATNPLIYRNDIFWSN